jgi:hypothetical protein
MSCGRMLRRTRRRSILPIKQRGAYRTLSLFEQLKYGVLDR